MKPVDIPFEIKRIVLSYLLGDLSYIEEHLSNEEIEELYDEKFIN